MSTVAAYAYLNARVSVFASRLLSPQQLQNLLQPSVGQKYTGIETLDNLLSDDKVSLSLVEQSLFLHLLHDVKALLRPLKGGEKELLLYWMRKCEVTNIKTIVRGKLSHTNTDTVSERLIELGDLSILPTEKLLRTEDINELLRTLENSHYGHIARQARRIYEQKHHLHAIDAAIDKQFLTGLHQHINALPAAQHKQVRPLATILFDRFNLLWLLRYRFAYHLSPAETFYLLVSTPYSLSREYLLKLVEFNSLHELLPQLPRPLYTLLANVKDIFEVEYALNMSLQQIAYQTLKFQSFSVAKAFAYLLLREFEMRQILAIIKGRRLGLKTDLILRAAHTDAFVLMI